MHTAFLLLGILQLISDLILLYYDCNTILIIYVLTEVNLIFDQKVQK